MDEELGQDILDDQAYPLDSLSSPGLANAELVCATVETAAGGWVHDSNGHLLQWSEEQSYADILAYDVGGQLGDNVHEYGPVHVGNLDPLFVISGVRGNPLLSVAAGGMGPEPVLSDLEVMSEHLRIHGILGGHILVGLMKVGGPVQDTWWTQGAVGGPMWGV
ncbi:hypothetical protein Y1Q_0008680 [Alligator mississippiensis]|uniref:Uncharacterized protein n=1 Tax=Alligator mississippiensis TaxID=8496 RepID=A0A151N9Q7_ALLMI|nr:hypothetical protein Y1Q_0008680 [Alligator mississippiensis]